MNLFVSLSSLVPLLLATGGANGESTPFLKEVMMGRCYFQPPSKDGTSDLCQPVVGGLVGVFESNLDSTVQVSSFDTYVEKADFSSPKDKALFWKKFDGESSGETSVVSPPSDLVSPEDTPGGAIVKDLLFCGVDQRASCSKSNSNAYWKFWEAAYTQFATQVQGRVQMVVEPMADVQFLIKSAVSHMDKSKITSVDIYGVDSSCDSQGVKKLMVSLTEAGFQNVKCDGNVMNLYSEVVAETPKGALEPMKPVKPVEPIKPPKPDGPKKDTVEDGGETKSTSPIPMSTGPDVTKEAKAEPECVCPRHHHPFLTFLKWVFWICVISGGVYYLYRAGYIPASWLARLGYEPVNDTPNGEYQRVSSPGSSNERLPLHVTEDDADEKADMNVLTGKDISATDPAKVTIQ